MTNATTTRLDAVNEMLRAIRVQPVADLDTEADVTTVLAEDTLDSLSRSVQLTGWSFNRRLTTLELDPDGHVPVSTHFMQVEARSIHNHFEVRDGFLFDMRAGTDEFTKDVCVYTIEYLQWDNLPQACRDLITKRAARKFVSDTLGDGPALRSLAADEQIAWASMRKYSITVGNKRIWDSGGSSLVDRGSPINHWQSRF